MTNTKDVPAFTDRTLPAPWEWCEWCGGPVPALPAPDAPTHCPECAQHHRLSEAARLHLAQLLNPVLAAWAHHYSAQGLTSEDLYACLELWAAAGLNPDAQQEHLTALLADSMQKYPVPSVILAPPDRVTLDARTLPQLLAVHVASGQPDSDGPGQIDRRLYFTARMSDGIIHKAVTLHPGRDALLILNSDPEHDALLYYTGLNGYTTHAPSDTPAYRVPADLIPQVQAALGYWGSAGGTE